MNHRDTDYLYISTRLKARSQNLFSREKLNRLIAARTGEDAVKLLTENGWAAFAPDDLSACEAEIARQQQESFELLYRYAPDRRMIDLFRLKYDYHNLKSVIKAGALGSDPSPLLSAAGTIPPAALLFAALGLVFGCISALQSRPPRKPPTCSPARETRSFPTCSSTGR